MMDGERERESHKATRPQGGQKAARERERDRERERETKIKSQHESTTCSLTEWHATPMAQCPSWMS